MYIGGGRILENQVKKYRPCIGRTISLSILSFMLFFVTISLVNVYNFAKNKNVSRIILHSFIALVVIVLPSVFESLIYMKIFTLLAYALVIAYVLLGIVYFFVSVRKSESALL